MDALEFGCCFCGEKTEDGLGLCLYDAQDNLGPEQVWWTHLNCLIDRMQPGYGSELHPRFKELRDGAQ